MPTGPDTPATTTLGTTTAAANAKSLEKSLEASLESSESFDELEAEFAHWVDVERDGSLSFRQALAVRIICCGSWARASYRCRHKLEVNYVYESQN